MLKAKMKQLACLALLGGGIFACSKMDMTLPEGPRGATGKDGKSAYELWVESVGNDTIPWKGSTTLADFFAYGKGKDGKDGKDGKSFLELWKDHVKSGKVNGLSPTDTLEADFWRWMSQEFRGEDGSDGADGKAGKSAYELWRDDLAARAQTDNPMTNHRTGEVWDPTANSLNDFWEYLRGRDGEVAGVRRIVEAQFSIESANEYLDSLGAKYKVYDERGALAPRAVVSGLPGIDADLTYTADDNGEFTIPFEDLPFHKEVKRGRVQRVAYNNLTVRSANETFVPNRILFRSRGYSPFFLYDMKWQMGYSFNIKRDEVSGWTSFPSAFSQRWNKVTAYRITDLDDPESFMLNSNGEPIQERWSADAQHSNFVGSLSRGEDKYYRIDFNFDSYPGFVPAAFMVHVPANQLVPTISTLTVSQFDEVDNKIAYVEGSLDFSQFDLTKVYDSYNYKTSMVEVTDHPILSARGRVECIPLSEAQAREMKFTVRFGDQSVQVSANNPSFRFERVPIGAQIDIEPVGGWDLQSGKSRYALSHRRFPAAYLNTDGNGGYVVSTKGKTTPAKTGLGDHVTIIKRHGRV